MFPRFSLPAQAISDVKTCQVANLSHYKAGRPACSPTNKCINKLSTRLFAVHAYTSLSRCRFSATTPIDSEPLVQMRLSLKLVFFALRKPERIKFFTIDTNIPTHISAQEVDADTWLDYSSEEGYPSEEKLCPRLLGTLSPQEWNRHRTSQARYEPFSLSALFYFVRVSPLTLKGPLVLHG